MKTFKEFLSEDAASDTQSTISRSVTGGDSDANAEFVSRKQFNLLKRKKKDDDDANRPTSPRPEKGGPLAKRPTPSSGSMVQKRTAASKQPPQHKQISARPASTAMAGSRQRPAIRPAKSNLSRDNMGVQKVNVQDLGPSTQKRLNPALK